MLSLSQRARQYALLGVAYGAILLALTVARPHSSAGPAMRDFEAYYCAGATLNAGGDPYGRDIWNCERTIPGVDASRDEVLPFVGPPPTLLVFRALARMPYDIARILWYVALLGAAATLALVPMLRLHLTTSRTQGIAIAVVLCIGFAPLTSDLALGQIALVSAAAVAASVLARPSWHVLTLCAASFQPNVGIAALASLRARGPWIAAFAAACAVYLAGAVVEGWTWPLTYARVLAAHASAERGSVIQHTPAAVLAAFGVPGALTATIAAIVALVALAWAIAPAVWRRDAVDCVAAGCVALPFIATFFHEHDFCAVLFAALVALGRTARPAVALVGSALVALDALGLAQRPQAALQSALLLTAFVCAALVVRSTSLRSTVISSGAIAATFAFAAAIGARHPVPIWPDALGDYHAAPTATVAAIWREEQERSHQTQDSASDAAARAIPLVGCALLGVALRYRRP